MTDQPFESNHYSDSDGNPAGGMSNATGIVVDWQNGPLVLDGQRVGPNGAFVETVIRIAKDRLEYYQTTRFGCAENAAAILKLDEALAAIAERLQRRATSGIEGSHGTDRTEDRYQP